MCCNDRYPPRPAPTTKGTPAPKHAVARRSATLPRTPLSGAADADSPIYPVTPAEVSLWQEGFRPLATVLEQGWTPETHPLAPFHGIEALKGIEGIEPWRV